MGNAARKLSPEEKNYYKKLISDKKPVDGISKPSDTNLELLTDDDNVEDVEGGEYTPPDLQLVGDEDNGEEGNEQNQPQINQEPDEQPSEAKKSTNNDLTKLEGESDADFQQRQMNAGKIPANDYQAQQQAQQSAVPGGKSDMSDKAIRDRELKRLQETTTNIDTGKTKRNGSSLKIGATALNNRYQDIKENFSFDALKERAKEQLKKLAYDALKKAAAAAWKSIVAATSEFWGPALLIIIGVIVIAVFIVILVRALQTPNGGGSSPVQAADIINDKPWISKILALAGDKDIANKMTVENLNGLLTDLSTLEGEINSGGYDATVKANGLAKITAIKTLITQFQALQISDPTRAEVAKNIVKSLAELIDIFSAAPFHYVGPTDKPMHSDTVTGYNGSLHGGTPRRRIPVNAHSTFIGWLKGWNDATDIGGRGGTPVYAAFDARIDDVRYRFGTVLLVSGTDQAGKKWQATYAHMQNVKFKQGDTILHGQQIGELNGDLKGPHLHFELIRDGKAVVTSTEDVADCNAVKNACTGNAKYRSIGKYLYLRDLSALNQIL